MCTVLIVGAFAILSHIHMHQSFDVMYRDPRCASSVVFGSLPFVRHCSVEHEMS